MTINKGTYDYALTSSARGVGFWDMKTLFAFVVLTFSFFTIYPDSALACNVAAVKGTLTMQGMMGTPEADAQIAKCQAQADAEDRAEETYTNYLKSSEESALRKAAEAEYARQQEEYEEDMDRYKAEMVIFLAEQDKQCKERYTGPNSHYRQDPSGCFCNVGYFLKNNICEAKQTEVIVPAVVVEEQPIKSQPPVVIERIIEKPIIKKIIVEVPEEAVAGEATTTEQIQVIEEPVEKTVEMAEQPKIPVIKRFMGWLKGLFN